MLIVVCYDISQQSPAGTRRWRKVVQACKDYGVRVQYSVFELSVEGADWVRLKSRLLKAIDAEQDSLRIYYIGADDARKTEHFGVREPLDLAGPLVF